MLFRSDMVRMIESLVARGHAYVAKDGAVYFDVRSFPAYGRLSGNTLDQLREGAGERIDAANQAVKRHPADFLLWKPDPRHLMRWPSPWGEGYPGWHIECSAMARMLLGDEIDLHSGGEDNIFPHHECEIAQTVCGHGAVVTDAAGQEMPTFARYWVHGRHLMVDGRKMSKRDGTFLTLRDLVDAAEPRPAFTARLAEAGFPDGRVSPAVLRAALVSTAFHLPLNFTVDTLVMARTFVERLQDRWDRLGEVTSEVTASPITDTHREAFDAALDDGLDMAAVFAAVGRAVTEVPATPSVEEAAAWRALIAGFDDVLAVLDRAPRSGRFTAEELVLGGGNPLRDALIAGRLPTDEELAAVPAADDLAGWLAARRACRAAKDYGRADELRRRLAGQGFVIEDRPDGVRWVRKG